MYTQDSHSTGKMKETALSLAPYLGSLKEIGSAVKYKDEVTENKRKKRTFHVRVVLLSKTNDTQNNSDKLTVFDGDPDGSFVGLDEGDWLGFDEGDTDGALLGLLEGDWLGVDVGSFDGDDDGVLLGLLEGD